MPLHSIIKMWSNRGIWYSVLARREWVTVLKWFVTWTTLAAIWQRVRFKIAAVTYKTKHSGLSTCQTTYMTTNHQGRFSQLQHSYFSNHDVLLPSQLVPLPSQLLTSGIHSLYKLIRWQLWNFQNRLMFISTYRTVQRHLRALFSVYYDLLRYRIFS